MSDKLKESLSATMDGEADEFELRRALDEVSADAELRSVWQRYHLVRGVLQDRRYGGYRRSAKTGEAVESMWRRIDAGEGLDEVDQTAGTWPSWMGRAAGFAVAATVAVAVVLGVDIGDSGSGVQVADSGPTIERPALPTALDAFPSRVDMQRTRAYMLHHAQHTSMYNQPGAVPFVKVAAFQGQ